MSPILFSIIHIVAAAALSAGGWIALYYYQPDIPSLIYSALIDHSWLVGGWLSLSIIGLDYSLTAIRDSISYRNVGSKAAAHWRLSGGSDK